MWEGDGKIILRGMQRKASRLQRSWQTGSPTETHLTETSAYIYNPAVTSTLKLKTIRLNNDHTLRADGMWQGKANTNFDFLSQSLLFMRVKESEISQEKCPIIISGINKNLLISLQDHFWLWKHLLHRFSIRLAYKYIT